MPNAASPPSSVVSADLTWRNICLMRRSRSPSWNQSWVWQGASSGCNDADSAGCGWIQALPAWAPSWPHMGSPSFKNCVTTLAWDCTWGNQPWWKTQTTEKTPNAMNQLVRNAGNGETLGVLHVTQYRQGKCWESNSGSCRLRRCSWISSKLWAIKTLKLMSKRIFVNQLLERS